SEYAQRFADNAIDLSVLPDLTDQDLEKIGVLLGHRRKILKAIAALNSDPAAQSDAAKATKPSSAPPRRPTLPGRSVNARRRFPAQPDSRTAPLAHRPTSWRRNHPSPSLLPKPHEIGENFGV